MIEPDEKLTLREVARDIGRPLEQVRRYVREGKLSAEKLGMQWLVNRRDLDTFKGTTGESQDDVLVRARALRESIRKRAGKVDVVGLLEESRRSHP